MDEQEKAKYRPWLILHLLPEIGRARVNRLLQYFETPDAVLRATPDQLAQIDGVGRFCTEQILRYRELTDPDTEMELVEQHGARLVCLHDPEYPANLRQMAAPPPLLYYRGTLEPLDEAAVAVIGSRKMSHYGHDSAQEIAGGLARTGVTVVSGLAIGVDGAAHRAALDAGGRTLAVLGNGLAQVYPAQHARLAEAVMENGALISELPMSMPPDPGSFPRRNSIIAGLSLGVVVVEAAIRSGTFITANNALDENRMVFAVPGDISRVNSIGTNQLIREGARLVTCAQDVLEDLQLELGRILNHQPHLESPAEQVCAPLPKDLPPVETLVCESLELDPMSVDVLAEAVADLVSLRQAETPDVPLPEITHSVLMGALLNLELRGLIKQEPGKRFRRVR